MCSIDWAATGAMLGGIATAIYALFTLFLWLTAKKDLDQTKKLHLADSRPWLEAQLIAVKYRGVDPLDYMQSGVQVMAYNHGKSPARIVSWQVGWSDDGINKFWSPRSKQTVIMPHSSMDEVFPVTEIRANERRLYIVNLTYHSGASENYVTTVEYIYHLRTWEQGAVIYT
ncbi:MAG: hypothetical protein WCH46_06850 [bacterium]